VNTKTAGAIDSNKLAVNAVVTAKIKDGAVTDAKIDSVSWGKVSGKPTSMTPGTGSVSEEAIVDSSITSNKIKNRAVTSEKIDTLAITTGKIADEAVTNAKIGGVAWIKVSDGPAEVSTIVSNALVPINTSLLTKADTSFVNTKVNAVSIPNLDGIRDTLSWKADASALVLKANRTSLDSGLAAANSDLDGKASTIARPTSLGNAVFVDASGNVRIGTQPITGALVVGSQIISASTDDASGISASGNTHINVKASGPSGAVRFWADGSERMRVGADGKVGIGTTTPSCRLDLGMGTGAKLLWYHDGLSIDPYIGTSGGIFLDQFNRYNNTTLVYPTESSTSSTRVGTFVIASKNTSNTGLYPQFILFGETGNLRIGSTFIDPVTSKLYVDGSIHATSTITSSDRRFKSSITPLSLSLEKIKNLQGVSYTWNRTAFPDRGFSEGTQIGLIAQDVEKVLPEVVHTDAEGYKSLSYDKLTAVLIEAVKEQQKTIEELQVKNRKLEAINTNLEARVSSYSSEFTAIKSRLTALEGLSRAGE
jgi:hypothetical protein